jgi:hypothetical protein
MSTIYLFWITIAFMGCVCILFLIAAFFWAFTRTSSYLSTHGNPSWITIMKWKMIHCLIIFLIFIYLQIGIRGIDNILCIEYNGELVLQNEQSTKCYIDDHLI